MSSSNFSAKVDFPQCQVFSEIKGLTILSVLSKMTNRSSVTGSDQTGCEKILKPEVKKYIFEKLV